MGYYVVHISAEEKNKYLEKWFAVLDLCSNEAQTVTLREAVCKSISRAFPPHQKVFLSNKLLLNLLLLVLKLLQVRLKDWVANLFA